MKGPHPISVITTEMAYRRKTIKRRVVKRRVVKRRVVKRRPTALRREIKQVISRMAENKSNQIYVEDRNVVSVASVSFIDTILPVGPHTSGIQINQGVGAGQRIGSRIRTKKLILQGTIIPNPYNAISNQTPYPTQYKMFIFYDKRSPAEKPAPVSDFFQLGNTASPLIGDLVAMWAPVNDEIYKVVATRTLKVGFAGFTTTGTSVGNSGFANNDFKANGNFRIDLTKEMIKNVVFEGNSTTPTSRTLWWMIVPAAANGGNYDTSQIPARISYSMSYVYEDM